MALVKTEDGGASVKVSREKTAATHGLTVEDVVPIERNGIAAKWPPLDVTYLAPKSENKPTE